MNTLENYYIQFFHQHNMSINEQCPPPQILFWLTYGTQLQYACA